MNETTEFSLFPGSHRLADRARSVPPTAWPFIVLAVLQTILFVGLAYLDFRNIAIWVIPPLFPVAVLIGRRDAWESARVIMIGAILWGSVAALVQVLGLGQQRFAPESSFGTPAGSSLLDLTQLASIISIAGPALVAQGLYRRRRTETTWPPALVVAALLVAAAFCVLEAKVAIDSYQAWEAYGVNSVASPSSRPLSIVAAALGPLSLLATGALAWTTLSAFRANEAPRRFWFAVCAGSSLLFASELYSHSVMQILGAGVISTDLVSVLWSATYDLSAVAILAGLVLLLIGFGLGLPDSDEDLLGNVLPDEAPRAT
jgi:hypothetical protein